MSISRRLATLMALVLATMFLPGSAALAAAPDNDTFDGSVVIDSLPFSDSVDTTEATTDEDDAEINAQCGAPATDASVWYSITTESDVMVAATVDGSDYTAGIAVAVGEPGSFEVEACGPFSLEFFVHGGVTHHLLVFDDQIDGEGNGGNLEFLVTEISSEVCPGLFIDSPDLEGFNIIVGTDGDDNLRGTPGPDAILGLAGNDQIRGFGGDDLIAGCDGDDIIDGGAGDDGILGDNLDFFGNPAATGGNDSITGGPGDDDVLGGPGDDHLDGGPGNDAVIGHQGDDVVMGGQGDDFVGGGLNDDYVNGGGGSDFVHGGFGDDHVLGGQGDDFLTGDYPNLGLDLGAGPGVDPNPNFDTCDGGPGANTVINCEG